MMEEEEEKMNYEHGGSSTSGESVFSGFGSSSDLNTPAGSELDSTESEEDDFIAELTRQMAENMLQEEDDDKKAEAPPPPPPPYVSETHTSYPATQLYSHHAAFADQYYHNQKKPHHHPLQNRDYAQAYGKREGFLSPSPSGSGMRVVFLGGVGSRNGSSGTGVFLPGTANNNLTDHHQSRKKPVCSTVLIPERVLQTLKQHFEKTQALTHSNGRLHAQRNQRLQLTDSQQAITNNQDIQLPQEWTY